MYTKVRNSQNTILRMVLQRAAAIDALEGHLLFPQEAGAAADSLGRLLTLHCGALHEFAMRTLPDPLAPPLKHEISGSKAALLFMVLPHPSARCDQPVVHLKRLRLKPVGKLQPHACLFV